MHEPASRTTGFQPVRNARPVERHRHGLKACETAALVLLLLFVTNARAQLPDLRVPHALGVNIHFTDPKPGELEMLAAAGFKWVRMDLGWGGTERKKGEYDFSAYDRLVKALDHHQLRAIFILDYGNSLYAEPGDQHPFTSRAGTEEFRAAYAR